MTPAPRLHRDLRDRGIAVWPEANGHVGYRAPPDALTAELHQAMVVGKAGLLALLESEVRWRVDAMRRQCAGRTVWPFLVARPSPTSPGHCLSCGEPLAAVEQTRCSLCLEAVHRVLANVKPKAQA
ncbi:MAG TPA: hypothetical protein VGK67_38390 [Myxococcales bacterium]|jgi:hypothetical protein